MKIHIGDFLVFRCQYDFVQLRDGGTSNSPLLGQHCGTTRPNSHRTTGHVLYVRFRSDSSVQRVGFKLRYSIGMHERDYYSN